MDAPEPENTPFAAVSAQTSKLGRVSYSIICETYICLLCFPHGSADTFPLPQLYQSYLDKSTPYTTYRWIGTAVLLALFFLRIVVAQGWYIGSSHAFIPCSRTLFPHLKPNQNKTLTLTQTSLLLPGDIPLEPLPRLPPTQNRPLPHSRRRSRRWRRRQ